MFGGHYLGQSIWSKTANAPKCGHDVRSIHECAGDELLSIARIGVVTKKNSQKSDVRRPISGLLDFAALLVS